MGGCQLRRLGLVLLTSTLGCGRSAVPIAPTRAYDAPPPAAREAQRSARPEAPAARALPAPASGLLLRVSPGEATLEINGESKGPLSRVVTRGALLALPRGVYRIVLRHEGYETWRGEVSVGDAPQTLQVTLAAIPYPNT